MTKIGTYSRRLINSAVVVALLLQTIAIGGHVYAADTGGYPWADATEINASTYDWGYDSCLPAMVSAQTCSTHYRYLLGVLYRLSDPWGYDVRNCTSYAAWRVHQSYGVNVAGWGNANTWSSSARSSGYIVDSLPRVGDIAAWSGGDYGHVAFVYEVNSDGSANIEQYNKAGRGEFSRQAGIRAAEYIHIAPPPVPVAVDSTPAPVVEPIAASIVPVPAPSDPSPQIPVVPEKDVVSYFVEKTPEEGLKTIAIKQNNTRSGKVEVMTAKDSTENAWSEPKVTEVPVTQQKVSSFVMGDFDGDKINDLFELKYNQTKSGLVEITVLDGKTEFKKILGSVQTKEKQHNEGDVYYDVADKNNDGKVDILQVWHNNTSSGLIEIKVFDGMMGYASNPLVFVVPEQTRKADNVYFMFGDHDGDSHLDMYEITHDAAESEKAIVKVFDISQTLAVPISLWKSETDAYAGRGPNINL